MDKPPSLSGLQLISQTSAVPEHPQSQSLLFLHAETVELPCTPVTTLRHPPLAGERHARMAGFWRRPRRAAPCADAPGAFVVVVIIITGLQHVDTVQHVLVNIISGIAANAARCGVIARATVSIASSVFCVDALVVDVVVAVAPSVADVGSAELCAKLGSGAIRLSIPGPLPSLAVQVTRISEPGAAVAPIRSCVRRPSVNKVNLEPVSRLV